MARTSGASLVVALAALGVAGWSLLEQRRVADEAGAARETAEAQGVRLLALDRALQALGGGATPSVALEGRASSQDAGPADDTAGTRSPGGPLLVRPETAALDPAARLAAMERKVASLQAAEDERAKRQAAGAQGPQISWGMPKGFWPTVDAAAKELDLDASQRANLERVVEDTRRQFDDLHALRSEDGASFDEIQKELQQATATGEDVESAFAEHMAKSARWRKSRVPGSNETFAQAEARLRREGRDRARSFLTADQAKAWDKGHPDAMFAGDASGSMATSFVSIEAPLVIQATPPAPAK